MRDSVVCTRRILFSEGVMSQIQMECMSNEELLRMFADSAVEARIARSGLCENANAASYESKFASLRSILLSRLDCVSPPFKQGDNVVVKNGDASPYFGGQFEGRLHQGTQHEVISFKYVGNRIWTIQLENGLSYITNRFEKVELVASFAMA